MDLSYDGRLFHGNVLRPSIHHSYHHRDPGHVVQGSHCYCQCAEHSEKPTIHKIAQLVLPGNNDVVSLCGERDILLQAYRACG